MPTAMPLDELIHLIGHWLLAYGIALTRPLAMLAVYPLFVRSQVTGLLRGGVATALAMPFIPTLEHGLSANEMSGAMLLLLVLKEVGLGIVLGLLLGVPLWSLNVAGDVLDVQRGASQAQEADFSGEGDMTFTGTLFMLTGSLVFVVSGGLQATVSILYHSWRIWPALSRIPELSPQTPSFLLSILDQVMAQALRLAEPIILAMLLADVGVILIGRIAPQLRVESHAITARNLVFFFILPIYSGYAMYYMKQDFSSMPHMLDPIAKAFNMTAPPP